MKEYLLGTLGAEERSALEERMLRDPQVYEELLAVEKDLIDQYEAGRLSKLEKHQFETHLLITAERRKNLRFGKLLKGHLTSHSIFTNKQAPATNLPFYLAVFRKAPVLAVSGALVIWLGLIIFSWQLAQKSAEDLVRQSASDLVVVTLSPGSTRTTGTTLLTLPPREADVKLELELTNAGFHVYKSELFQGSEALDTRNGLRMEARGDHHVIPVIIPARVLRPGEYRLKLSGVPDSAADQFVENYSFRVTKN